MLRTIALFLASAALALPGTVISVTGSNPGGINLGGIGAVSWTQSGAFSGVSISAVMTNSFGTGQSIAFHAYLTDAIGPGATVADEIDSTAFSIAPGFNQTVNLFNGLSLGPGTYFLVISSDLGATGAGGWSVTTSSPTVTTGLGVTRNADRGSNGAAALYPPATNIPVLTGGSLLYSVTASDVPEPATTALIACGLAIIAVRRRG
ncbi:MAG: PEP-CTERM sorting domain-containing protein [Bryobacterales bacterium]|nr:PEP-CTERM sorting domain-containing protein [Bryobacterales bacterium]